MAISKVTDLRAGQGSRAAASPEYRLFDNLIFRVNRLASSYFKSAARYYQQRFDMGIPEIRLLNIVGHYEPLGSSDIVAQSSMDKAMVSRALAALIRLGYIRRVQDAHDNRRIVLTTTESGRAVWKRILDAKRARHDRSIAALSPEEVRLVYDLLDRLYETAEEMRRDDARDAD